MKKVLFIIPSIWTAGTNSALSSLLNNIGDKEYNIRVFPVTLYGRRDLPYSSLLLPKNRLLSAYFADLKKSEGIDIVLVFVLKSLKKICSILKIDLFAPIAKRAARQLSNQHFDTVVGFMEGAATELASFVEAGRRISWVHCNYDKYLPSNQSEEDIYSRFNVIVNVSAFTTTIFRNRYPALANNVICINNLVDEKRIQNLSRNEIDYLPEDESQFTIISVGRISPVKRFSFIPSIVWELLNKGVNVKWLIIGPNQDADETARLKANVEKYNVEKAVRCLGLKDNPYPYFKKANLYVCLSESEACPMVFIEARLLGLPILSTDFPSAKEFINDGKDGIICKIKDVPDKLYDLINNKELCKSLISDPNQVTKKNTVIIDKIKNIL